MYWFFKRFFDIMLALFSLVLLALPFLLIAIMIKTTSKGPVFFRQNRLGKNGKIFKIIKFRTMVVNAEKIGSGLYNYKGDPRVTKIGAVLRKTSIDELPQVFSVLSGKMSFIGPRPAVEYELGDFETLNAQYKKRFIVKPGISGLAQVSGRNELPWNQKIIYDNQYIDLLYGGRGFRTDVKIFFKTIGKLFQRSDDICEVKMDENLDDVEAARLAEEEIIRLAHCTTNEVVDSCSIQNDCKG